MPVKKSMTFIQDPHLKIKGGTTLLCECSWKGPLLTAVKIEHSNKRGALILTQRACPRCFASIGDVVILLEDRHTPPIDLMDQGNGWEDPREEL